MQLDSKYINDILVDLNTIESKLIQNIKTALSNGLSKIDIVILNEQIDFFNDLTELGYESKIKEYFSNYDEIVKQINSMAEATGIPSISKVSINELEIFSQIKYTEILGNARNYSNILKSKLIAGILTGTPDEVLIKEMSDIPLTNTQLRTILNTGYAEFETIALHKAYENNPEQRFILVGADDNRVRPTCYNVLHNQPVDGFTKKEIDEGAWTTLALSSELGRKKLKNGDYSFTFRGGHGCRHRPIPIVMKVKK